VSFGTFTGNSILGGRICQDCNNLFGRTIDQELIRIGPTGFTRQLLGITGRRQHKSSNVFEFRVSQAEPPIQADSTLGGGRVVPVQGVSRNSDGTFKSVQMRSLTISMPDGVEAVMPFPRSWQAPQLKSAAGARGLLTGRVTQAHVAPPETVPEFLERSLSIIREVFGSGPIDVYVSTLEGEVLPVEYRRVRFEFTPEYHRGVAKVAFHYFLWSCPSIGGNESVFADLRGFLRHGEGKVPHFVLWEESAVSRSSVADGGTDQDCHLFAWDVRPGGIIVSVHFFSQAVGPQLPTFRVRLGTAPPAGLPVGMRRGHIAFYDPQPDGHDGILREFGMQPPES